MEVTSHTAAIGRIKPVPVPQIAATPARFRQEWLMPRTPLAGLYLTGQDIGSAGVIGACGGEM